MKTTEITFKPHMYEWHGEVHLQQDGCPTGLHPSGPISRVYRDFWMKMLKEIEDMTKTLHALNPVNFAELTTHLINKTRGLRS